jgi:uncharacterized protein YjiS (DUF1127 family)
MYHSSPDRPIPGLAGLSKVLAEALGRRLRRFSMRVMQWHERRKGLESLRALSDHQLHDIGLRRSDVVMAAYGLHDRREALSPVAAVNLPSRSVPTEKKADNNDANPCIGCAA